MPETQRDTPRYTQTQLDRRACITCATESEPLVDAGHVTVPLGDGETLTYAVVSCPEHRGDGS